MSSANYPEFPSKTWKVYSESDLKAYFLRNFDKADCSFVIIDPNRNINSKRELRSFHWMLREFSPVLKEILSDEKNRAKNFKMIPVPDKNFDALLSFVHTRTLQDGSFSYLLDLFETAIKYKSHYMLTEAIKSKLEAKDPVGNWIRFAALAWRDKDTNESSYYLFNRIWNKDKEWKKQFEHELTTNLETCSHFDFKLFHALLCALKDLYVNVSPLSLFKTVEAYVLKNISKGKTLDEMKNQNNLIEDTANIFLSYVEFRKMTIEDFENGPAKSALLGEELKKRYRSEVRK